jgi:polygalacturonase
VKSAGSAAAGLALLPQALRGQPAQEAIGAAVGSIEEHGWERVPSILARIKPPAFAKKRLSGHTIRRQSRRHDRQHARVSSRHRRVRECRWWSRGRRGWHFLTGPIRLRSRVNLEVREGATIKFITDPKAYEQFVLTRFEGVELLGLSPLIYALDAVNVAVTGAGTLDGQASNTVWWHWNGSPRYGWKQGAGNQRAGARPALRDGRAQRSRRVASLRRRFVSPAAVHPALPLHNVLIEGVTIRNSPMWEINPVLCRNVTVRGVQIDSHGPNNDGCDPESCRDVLIERCRFDTGDDCIAIKSGRNADGRRVNVPTENVIIRDCEMRDGHGGVTDRERDLGRRAPRLRRTEQDGQPAARSRVALKNNAMRGGVLEHIYMRDVQVGQLADAVLQVDFLYEEGANGNFPPSSATSSCCVSRARRAITRSTCAGTRRERSTTFGSSTARSTAWPSPTSSST